MSTNPVVYFIDDSATMREVIKIAFRRENLNVIACHDAASAIAQMEETAPDVVISDVIMPEKDGYEVCQHIKQHQRLGHTPVILMSGVVNRSVAERAFAVKADELIRKPFQPQDLITRVRHLLNPKAPAQPPAAATAQATATAAALSSIFATPASSARPVARVGQPPVATMARPAAPIAAAVPAYTSPAPIAAAPQAFAQPSPVAVPRVPQPPASAMTMDVSKMRMEIMRLQSQIKKLESELAAEREYSHALEEHIKTLQETE
jgi:CheY-like chemotaxis protein